MKILRILPLAAVACAMVSCQFGGSGLSDNSSQTDSLMYYLGQINASEYLREANRDTTLKETAAKQAYLAGVKAGLNVLRDGDQNYNKGVMLGVQMASNMVSFSEQMNVKIDKNAYYSSISSALMADSMPNSQIAQEKFTKFLQSIEQGKNERDEKNSRESLKKAAESAGLPKISDDLYGKAIDKTDGVALTDGDEVETDVVLTKTDGGNINLPLQKKGNIGNKRYFPDIISEAIKTLKSGETGEFMTTAHALTPGRAQQLNLKPEDVVKMTITATVVPTEDKKEENK